MIACGRCTFISFLSLFLDLTAVLWAPQNWIYWLQWLAMTASGGVYIDVGPLVSNPKPQCLSREEKVAAVGADADVVSGWYGPGAYLAWLFTVYVSSLSAIWNADYSDGSDKQEPERAEDDNGIDGELLASLTYPAVAMLDILYRFIRCKVDPSLNAAMLVVLAGVFSIGTTRRLVAAPDLDEWAGGQFFPSGPRQWILSVFLVVGHSLIWSTMAEPYNDWKIVTAIYAIALGNILHSSITIERVMDRYPYRIAKVKRPRMERVAVFLGFQAIFLVVVGTTRKSIFPQTGASLSDLDQCAALVTIVVATMYAHRMRLWDWVQQARVRLSGFRPVQSNPSEV